LLLIRYSYYYYNSAIIQESGPHMVFVTIYANDLVPFAVLFVILISQDGHGSLPLFSVSTKVFSF